MREVKESPILVYEVPTQCLGEHLAAYLVKYGQILSATSDELAEIWCFDIMRDWKTFISVTKCLDLEGQAFPVIVTGHERNCKQSEESGHLSSSYSENKASGVMASAYSTPFLVKYVISVLLVMGIPTIGTGVVKPSVLSKRASHFPKSFCQPLMSSWRRKKREWMIVVKTRRKPRTARRLSPETHTGKGLHSPTHSTGSNGEEPPSYGEKSEENKA